MSRIGEQIQDGDAIFMEVVRDIEKRLTKFDEDKQPIAKAAFLGQLHVYIIKLRNKEINKIFDL